MSDPVKHPDHYTWLPGVECIDVVRHFNFNLGGAIKYIWRSGKKDDAVQDLRKAIQLLENEIDRLEHDESVGDVKESGQKFSPGGFIPQAKPVFLSIDVNGKEEWEELGFTVWGEPTLYYKEGRLRVRPVSQGGIPKHSI